MDVPSLPFMALAALAAGLFNLSAAPVWRQAVLLATNLLFLASFVHHPMELAPYAGFLALGFLLIQLLQRGAAAWRHGAAIILVLIVFFWLKQYTFLPASLFLSQPYLLVGLSYVFFRVMHLVIDAREGFARLHVVDYVNYTLNFTSLVSGPIQRYEDYHRMATVAPLSLRLTDMGIAVERIVTGLFKIWVMAVAAAILQRYLTHGLLSEPGFLLRVGNGVALAALYPVYLFFNFSGYTDFVIGIARFFRIELPENFDMPFSSCSFIEYWGRWHMSLSNWLKTYVYNPLLSTLLRRVQSPLFLPYAGAVSLFVTFFLIGVWHGRTSAFFVFGLLNGLGMAVNQAFRIIAARRLGRKPFAALSKRPLYRFVGRGLTFTWLAFTLLWFWSDWPQLAQFAQVLGAGGLVAGWLAMAASACVVLGALQWVRRAALAPAWSGRPILLSRYVRTAWLTTMLFLIFAVQNVMSGSAPDVVYKSF